MLWASDFPNLTPSTHCSAYISTDGFTPFQYSSCSSWDYRWVESLSGVGCVRKTIRTMLLSVGAHSWAIWLCVYRITVDEKVTPLMNEHGRSSTETIRRHSDLPDERFGVSQSNPIFINFFPDNKSKLLKLTDCDEERNQEDTEKHSRGRYIGSCHSSPENLRRGERITRAVSSSYVNKLCFEYHRKALTFSAV